MFFPLQFWGVNNMYLGMVGGESYTRGGVRVHHDQASKEQAPPPRLKQESGYH